jgi:hypothetical protein
VAATEELEIASQTLCLRAGSIEWELARQEQHYTALLAKQEQGYKNRLRKQLRELQKLAAMLDELQPSGSRGQTREPQLKRNCFAARTAFQIADFRKFLRTIRDSTRSIRTS